MKYISALSLLFSASTVFGVLPHAYVTDQLDGSVRVIRVASNTVQTISGFHNPRVIKVTADGTLAYVGSDENTIRIIDTITNTLMPHIINVNHPVSLAITPKTMYVASSDNTVTVINTLDYSTQAVITGFDHPADIKVRPDGQFVYVTNTAAGTISVIDPSTNAIVGTITGFKKPVGMTFTVGGEYAYVTDPSHNEMYVVRLTDNSIVETVLGLTTPSYIAVTPDESYAFISNTGNDTVSVMRTSDNVVVHTIPIPDPKSIAITQDGQFLYVGSGFGEVFKVRILDYSIETAIPNFKNPSNITLTTNNAPADTVNGCQEFSSSDVTNHITWHAAGGTPIGYKIYRDLDLTKLVASLPPTTFSYDDSMLEAGQTYIYYMLAEYADGFSTTIGSVEITPTRICQDL